MKILLIGATGTIGSAITKEAQQMGHQVIGVSRSSRPSIDIENNESVDSFFRGHGLFDAIVCVAGRASFGSFQKLSDEEWRLGLDSKLQGQVRVSRHGLSSLNPGGKIILTGGMLAYSPWPDTSNIALVNAGLEGFVRAINLELTDKKALIVHPPLVKETALAMGMDGSTWPSSSEIAKVYLDTLEASESIPVRYVSGYTPEALSA
ncbi:MAG: SDR family NAD(P)-dependent oxidoreductase [Flavobacteriales bacterium]|nr:SDR family NAD(P)-dependent oxidoreductase [Flavobacteriales bacterium]